MDPVHSHRRIDIIIHNGDAAWWQIVAALGPLVVLLGAVLIAVIGWLTLRRRPVADAVAFDPETKTGSQSDWWHRARWALGASIDDDPARREVGFAALELLNASALSGKEETLIIAEAWKSALRDREKNGALTETKSIDESDSQSSISPKEERVVVRAARLRLSTDKNQGIESPPWVKEIAKGALENGYRPDDDSTG